MDGGAVLTGIFDFDSEKNKASERLAQPNAQSNGGGVAAATSSAAREAANAEVQRVKRKYTRRNAPSSDVDSQSLQSQVNAAIAAQLQQLHSPEAWSALACLPADAARTWTGADRWKLSDEERKTLGITCSAAAQTFMITNPRALACSMALAAIAGTYLPRMLAQLKEMREKAEAKAKEKPQ